MEVTLSTCHMILLQESTFIAHLRIRSHQGYSEGVLNGLLAGSLCLKA